MTGRPVRVEGTARHSDSLIELETPLLNAVIHQPRLLRLLTILFLPLLLVPLLLLSCCSCFP